MKIGDKIKKRREELGLSVDELATKIGKNRATIYRYESKKIEKLPINILKPLADALQTTESYLMGWEDKKINDLTNHEEEVILAYRNKPEMQNAVDKLLGVESSELADDMINTIQKVGIPTRKK